MVDSVWGEGGGTSESVSPCVCTAELMCALAGQVAPTLLVLAPARGALEPGVGGAVARVRVMRGADGGACLFVEFARSPESGDSTEGMGTRNAGRWLGLMRTHTQALHPWMPHGRVWGVFVCCTYAIRPQHMRLRTMLVWVLDVHVWWVPGSRGGRGAVRTFDRVIIRLPFYA